MNDERNMTIRAAINRKYRGKLAPFDDKAQVPVATAVRTCQAAGFYVTAQALSKAIDRRTLKLDRQAQALNKGELLSWAQWRDFNAGFRPEEMTARHLARAIYKGHAFTPLYRQNWRRRENFEAAWHVALDFDTGDARSALATHAADELAWLFASFAYTTPSHTAERPKSRLVFVFPYEEPITAIDEYEELYRALLWRFPAADTSTKDAARLFYGSVRCEVWLNWSVFPKAARDVVTAQHREHLAAQAAQATPAAVVVSSGGVHGRYVEAAVARECARISAAAQGERHDTLTRAGFSIGGLVGASWCDLTHAQALSALVSAASWASGQNDVKEIERVLGDALAAGSASPRSEPQAAAPALNDMLKYQ